MSRKTETRGRPRTLRDPARVGFALEKKDAKRIDRAVRRLGSVDKSTFMRNAVMERVLRIEEVHDET